jgi:hypothetical protein
MFKVKKRQIAQSGGGGGKGRVRFQLIRVINRAFLSIIGSKIKIPSEETDVVFCEHDLWIVSIDFLGFSTQCFGSFSADLKIREKICKKGHKLINKNLYEHFLGGYHAFGA